MKEEKLNLKERIRLLNPEGAKILDFLDIAVSFGNKTPIKKNIPNVTEVTPVVHIEEKKTSKIIQEAIILPKDYSQIVSTATKKEILNFLRPLAEEKNSLNQYYMDEMEFTDFLLQVFTVFNRQPKGKYFSLNLTKRQKGKMRCLIAQFRIKYGSKTIDESKTYALLLINNFELFKNDKLSSLINSMKPSKWPIEKNRIPTSQKK